MEKKDTSKSKIKTKKEITEPTKEKKKTNSKTKTTKTKEITKKSSKTPKKASTKSEVKQEKKIKTVEQVEEKKDQIKKEELVIENKPKKEKSNFNKRYLSFYDRIAIYTSLFVIFMIVSILFIGRAFELEEQKMINYKEQSDLDYKVYLKKNKFYEQEYLGKDMVYISNLIDDIKIDYLYKFNIDEPVDLNLKYNIIAKLVISEENGKNDYYVKSYKLLDDKKIELRNRTEQTIKDSIKIDYEHYNKIAEKFRLTYGVSTSSKLIVNLNVYKENASEKSENSFISGNASNMSLTIPLSEKSVNIKMNYQKINNSNKIVSTSKVIMDNIVNFIISMISLIIAMIFMIKIIRLFRLTIDKKNAYDKYINRLLKEYDRLIVETTTPPVTKEKEVIKIDKFNELLDVRENVKMPIMYYNIARHIKGQFYINCGNTIYITTIKNVDLEEE